ncbi:TPA: hypothetical protein SLV97_001020 [Pseudomonas aeruginosa]|nr:hypothetical protein [Pseudomonas aeruginosa]
MERVAAGRQGDQASASVVVAGIETFDGDLPPALGLYIEPGLRNRGEVRSWVNSVCGLSYPIDNSQGCYVAQYDLQGGEQVGHQELLTLVRVVFCAWASIPVDLC